MPEVRSTSGTRFARLARLLLPVLLEFYKSVVLPVFPDGVVRFKFVIGLVTNINLSRSNIELSFFFALMSPMWACGAADVSMTS